MTAAFRIAYPDPGTYNVDDNGDNARFNMQTLRDCIIANGMCPGFDLASTTYHAGTTNPHVLTFQEQTAHAAADTPTRAAGARWFFRVTCTNYTAGGLVQKIRFERSVNAGSSYSNWTDLAGNSYVNLTWNANNTINTYTWGTS